MAAPSKKAFALRLDPAVHAAVERLAGAELRSANAQIEVLLREALERRGIAVGRSDAPRRGRPPKEG
ncbi:toxin-antitoxin system HicB family antitoxin [Erythrobacter sp. JK5]|uniref:toxin-antitoxin system HicB family antitoxin n=1 Tax=Erythrobacter sp. JK5 TaxID=2829500 RepID=UPI001BA9852B|nr:toxin-antitoxin system HicB family antitoxin [Erythrobacter sp. JK5]QUL37099.1 toxin-antitoxin system HicB family antitoxin [Erythrobacter sp. JK5]